MIQKVLGQEYEDLEARRQFLLDNADSVVEMDYHKQFDADELAKKKTELSDVCIRISDIEDDVKEYRAKAKDELRPLKSAQKQLLSDVKTKGRVVTEKCYCFIEHDDKMACFYNGEGVLVSSRPATRDELKQQTFFQMRRCGGE